MNSEFDRTIVGNVGASVGDGDDGAKYLLNNDPTIIDPAMADPTAVVVKKRKPMVKLTSERLIGDNGLPYVMKNAPKRVHISKRKNAHDNFNNILLFYQLWAHNLYPKAKFRDFIKLTQSLGRSDRVLREYRTLLFRKEMGMIDEEELNKTLKFLQNNNDLLTMTRELDATKEQVSQEPLVDTPIVPSSSPKGPSLFHMDSDLSDDGDEAIYNVTRNETAIAPSSSTTHVTANEEDLLMSEIKENQLNGNRESDVPDHDEELALLKEFESERQKLEGKMEQDQDEIGEDEMELMRGM